MTVTVEPGDMSEKAPEALPSKDDGVPPVPVPADIQDENHRGQSEQPSEGDSVHDEGPIEESAGVPADDDTLNDEVAAESAESSDDEGAQDEAAQEELENVEPLQSYEEESDEDIKKNWYILKVQVNREDSIREALQRRVKIAGMDKYFGEIIVPTEDVAEFTKSGKRRIVKRKLYPGYIVVNMSINEETWFLVRETPGIGDFTGSAGKPSPMPGHEVDKILKSVKPDEDGGALVRTGIPFKPGDRVRVKEGNFQNFEGDVASIDQANGRVTVNFIFFGRSTPVEIPHWQIEAI